MIREIAEAVFETTPEEMLVHADKVIADAVTSAEADARTRPIASGLLLRRTVSEAVYEALGLNSNNDLTDGITVEGEQ